MVYHEQLKTYKLYIVKHYHTDKFVLLLQFDSIQYYLYNVLAVELNTYCHQVKLRYNKDITNIITFAHWIGPIVINLSILKDSLCDFILRQS